jgi:hypothetical protein
MTASIWAQSLRASTLRRRVNKQKHRHTYGTLLSILPQNLTSSTIICHSSQDYCAAISLLARQIGIMASLKRSLSDRTHTLQHLVVDPNEDHVNTSQCWFAVVTEAADIAATMMSILMKFAQVHSTSASLQSLMALTTPAYVDHILHAEYCGVWKKNLCTEA